MSCWIKGKGRSRLGSSPTLLCNVCSLLDAVELQAWPILPHTHRCDRATLAFPTIMECSELEGTHRNIESSCWPLLSTRQSCQGSPVAVAALGMCCTHGEAAAARAPSLLHAGLSPPRPRTPTGIAAAAAVGMAFTAPCPKLPLCGESRQRCVCSSQPRPRLSLTEGPRCLLLGSGHQ